MCVYFADPVEVLLTKPPPSISSSFFQKVSFLFDGDKKVQSYVKKETFEERYGRLILAHSLLLMNAVPAPFPFSRRVAVVRGRVVTPFGGQGITGVRVSVTSATTQNALNNFGFTMTRPGGW